MAPLQKRALITFLIGLVFSAALAVVLVLEGDPTAFEDSEFIRWIMYITLVGVPLSYLLLIDFSLRKPTELDERDRLIMLRSGSVQWLAIAFALAVWTVGPWQSFFHGLAVRVTSLIPRPRRAQSHTSRDLQGQIF